MANTIEITVKVRDQASAETAAIAEKIRTQMKAAQAGSGEGVRVPVEPDMTGFDEEVRTKTRRTRPDPIKVPLEVPKEDFEAEFRKAMDEGEQVANRASSEMRRSFTAVESGSRSLRAAMQELEPATNSAGSGMENAGRRADEAGKKAEAAGSGFRFGSLGMAAMVTGALALAP
ncbi:MAG: hypothetical protein HOV66_04650, partial [Streptomycetaceae bacterium]|nr:hypothetical protein [Streptomycetaceae bacterium]